MKKIALIFTFSLAIISLNAQDESFRQSFLEANTLMEENQHNVALPIWLKLQAINPANFNVNYKVGVCYIKSSNDKRKALNYLVKAVQNTTKNYDPFSSSEKRSPVESYFYLAKAYHINYELNNAMLNYNSFKEKISKKHYLFNEVDHHIEQCKNAKIAINNPVNIKVGNMGPIINSFAGDYSPVLSVDESTIYFTSRRTRKDSSNYYIKDVSDGKHYEDIYVSYNYDGVWTEPELLGINTEGHEATVNISTDGQTLFIYKDDNGDGNIYTSKYENGEWSTPLKLGSDINLESRETHAHISPDGNFLYFVSDRKKGMGGQDIYLCKKLPNGQWAKAQNLGGVINTPYDEDGVFIHPDGKTMYFSSKGHNSIGGFDIFYSVMDDAGNWSKPVNMGYPVNSTDHDVFFVTSADGKRGYYSSFQEKGYGEKDIYKISLEDADAKPLTLLTGYIKVIGQDETPDDAIITVTNNETDEREKIYRPRKKDGKFSIILEPGNDYHIVYSAAGYTQEEDLYIPPISAYQEINRGINLDDVIFGNPEDSVSNTNTNNSNTTSNNTNTNNSNTANNNTSTNDTATNNTSTNNTTNNTSTNDTASNTTNSNNTANNNTNTNSNTNNSNTNSNTSTSNQSSAEMKELKAMIEALRNEVKELRNEVKELKNKPANTGNNDSYNDIENPTNVTTEIGEVSYAQYFAYNKNRLDREDAKYKEMISKAAEKCKTTRRLVITIASSASKVPSKTFKTNDALAYKRGIDAKRDVTTSLLEKGVSINTIIFKEIDSSVNGPDYGEGKIQNTDVYEKYQYVIIKIK